MPSLNTRPSRLFSVVLLFGIAVYAAILGYLALTPATLDMVENGAQLFFTVDRRLILPGGCVTARWQVEGTHEVYLNGGGKIGEGAQTFCANQDIRATWRIVFKDQTSREYSLYTDVLLGGNSTQIGLLFSLMALVAALRPHQSLAILSDLLAAIRNGWNALIRLIRTSSAYSRLALICFVVISAALTYYGRNERSGWIKMTAPAESTHATNALLGYTFGMGREPIHIENLPSVEQVIMFSGAPSEFSMYSVRAVYTFLAALLAPFVGIIDAFVLVNYLAWAAAAWITWRFTRKLFQDELAALIAVILVTGGIGMVAHVGDYSAHLLSFTFYYLGVLLIYESGVWRERQPLRTHLILGVFLAIASLQYNTGLALIIGYLAVAVRRNRWIHLVIAAAIALSAQSIWLWFLGILGLVINGKPIDNLYGTEQAVLRTSLIYWQLAFSQPPGIVRFFFDRLAEFALFDSPLVVMAGLLAFTQFVRRLALLWFFGVFFALPLAAGMVYVNSVTARGYLIYGGSILVYAALAGALAKAIHRAGIFRVVAVAALVVIVGSHFLWSTAHLWGNIGPVKTFFLGLDDGGKLLTTVPQVVSLTGVEPTPALFGGQGTLTDAGLYFGADARPVQPSFPYALLARSMFFLYLALLMLVAVSTLRARSIGILALVFAAITSSALSAVTFHEAPATLHTMMTDSFSAGQDAHLTISLSEAFVEALENHATSGDTLLFYMQINRFGMSPIKPDDTYALKVFVGDHALRLTRPNGYAYAWVAADLDDALDAFRRSHQLVVQITPKADLMIGGWQRPGLRGRMLDFQPPKREGIRIWPTFEIRLINADGALKFAGF